MAYEHRHRRRAEFAETDLAGIVHFSQYFRYVEEAEHAFLRSLGLSVVIREEGSAIGFPRASVRCEYRKPIRFEDEVEVHLWVLRKGARSISYQFSIAKGEEKAAFGEFHVICCRSFPDGRLETVPLPAGFLEKLDEAPYPPLAFR